MKTVLITVLATIAAVMVASALGLWLLAQWGAINVAASADFLPGVERFFSTLSENSIRNEARAAVRAGRITPPADITQAMLDTGRHHYDEMCVVCHGAPGVERGETGAGLKPAPPEIAHVAEEMSLEEIYWVVDNGIRHTGMPAYGATHSPEEMWAIAAFVKTTETMTPEEYQRGGTADTAGAGSGDGHSGHTH